MPETSAPTTGRAAYIRGRRYREELLAAGRAVLREAPRTTLRQAVRLLPFSASDPGSKVADALAKEYGTDRRTLQADARYAAAVDTIALNCGRHVLAVLLDGHPLLSRRTTEQISRTAPPRQRYEMEQVVQGRRPLRGPAPVFDTTDFAEVISRLRRAEGKVRAALSGLRNAPAAMPQASQDLALLVLNARGIIGGVIELAQMVRSAAEDQPDECEQSPARRRTRACQPGNNLPKCPGYQGVAGRLSQAGCFIRKCVRDLPVLLNEVKPLRREKDEIEERVKRIVGDIVAILHVIGAAGASGNEG
jgi:hypothetical protein